jgi:hypothetical protein
MPCASRIDPCTPCPSGLPATPFLSLVPLQGRLVAADIEAVDEKVAKFVNSSVQFCLDAYNVTVQDSWVTTISSLMVRLRRPCRRACLVQ